MSLSPKLLAFVGLVVVATALMALPYLTIQ
jgi:hypothetical protein